MNIEVKKLNTHEVNEFIQLIRLFEEVFEMENFSIPEKAHLEKLLAKPGFFVFTAAIEDKIVGGLTAYVLDQYYSEKPLAYLYDLAVKTEYQRKGVGKKLIAALNDYCRNNNFEEVFVQADKVDDYALDFYRSTPISGEEQVVHFTYRLDKH